MDDRPEKLRQEHLQGMTYKALAEKYYIDQRTAKRYVQLNLPLSELDHRAYISILDPFKPLIDSWILDGHQKYKPLYEMLKAKGYEGSYHLMYRYARSKEEEFQKASLDKLAVKSSAHPSCPESAGYADHMASIEGRIKEEEKYVSDHIG